MGTKITATVELARLSVRFRTMEKDDGAELVASVAEEFVGKLGKGAVPHLRFEESLAVGKGDDLSAEAWHDIANAAALILKLHARIAARAACYGVRDPSGLSGADAAGGQLNIRRNAPERCRSTRTRLPPGVPGRER